MIKQFLAFIYIVCLPLFLFAQDIPEPMRPARAVNDFAGMLSQEEQAQLERKLRNYNDSTSSSLVVVTVPNTGGMDIARYTTELAHKWGVGEGELDNGLVILVSRNDKRINISTGYGLEGAVPDALAKRIIEQQMEPLFSEGNYYAGLNAATDTIIQLASGEYSAVEFAEEDSPDVSIWLVLLVLLFLIVFPILRVRQYRKGHIGNSRRSVGWWPMLFLMGGMGSRGGHSYHDFNSGGGAFGGGSGGGGGFGGFGGGGFGGGGASGGW